MAALIPDRTVCAASIDLPWFWANFGGLRKNREVAGKLREFQSQLGVSVERDVIPWAGECGAALIGLEERDDPRLAVYMKVRDWRQFVGTIRRLEAAGGKAGPKWTLRRYKGSEIRSASVPMLGRRMLLVSICCLRGWCVVTTGAGTIESVIDTFEGRTPSLASELSWQQALEQLPKDSRGWIAFDFTGLIRVTSSPARKPRQGIGAPQWMHVVSFSAKSDELRADAVGLPGSPETERALRELSRRLKPVDNTALRRFPAKSSAVLLVDNPALCWSYAQSQILGLTFPAGPTTDVKKDIPGRAFRTFPALTGPCGIGIAPGKEQSISVFASGHTRSDEAARGIVSELKPLMGDSVRQSGCWVDICSVPRLRGTPCSLRIPREASGASVVTFGNLRCFNESLHDCGLDRAEWVGWSRIDAQDGCLRSSLVVKLHWERTVEYFLKHPLL